MSKPSQAQIEANRNNAKSAHGPTSASGKRRSSQNALRHGLTGRVVVLPTEDMEAYKNFSKELVESLNAETPMERQLAQTVADTQWRLNRARSIEDGMLAMGLGQALSPRYSGADEHRGQADHPDVHSALTAAKVFREHSKDFVNLSLYEQRLSRAQKEAFRQLREIQAERKAAPPKALAETKPLTQTAAAGTTPLVRPYPLNTDAETTTSGQQIGFVYSAPEIEPVATGTTAFNPGRLDAKPNETPRQTAEKKAA